MVSLTIHPHLPMLLRKLRYDAQQTLEQLNDSTGTDLFADVFLKDQTHLLKRCDAVIRQVSVLFATVMFNATQS